MKEIIGKIVSLEFLGWNLFERSTDCQKKEVEIMTIYLFFTSNKQSNLKNIILSYFILFLSRGKVVKDFRLRWSVY